MVLCIVGVQAELFLNAPVLYSQVICYVVKNYCDQLTKECKSFMDTNCNHDQLTQVLFAFAQSAAVKSKIYFQLYLDYCAFQNSVRAFLSQETLNSMETFKQQISVDINFTLVQDKIEKFVHGMQLCLCSLQENPVVADT
ncbi:unnamed protein product [Soboliphyme baturini]|uniref:Secreted protein n=1 Tax=Soboliphyme baturini TaxID=241478 RepID=A0A183I916_9BILA|nr:unnamed protein product [Soboliphyme baturini]